MILFIFSDLNKLLFFILIKNNVLNISLPENPGPENISMIESNTPSYLLE